MAEKHQKELGGTRQMSLGTKIVVGVFAVMMALSMMLPSLTAIFASDDVSEQSEQTDDETTTDDEATTDEGSGDESDDKTDEAKTEDAADDATKDDDPTADVPDNESLKSLATQNASKVAAYEERLEADPTDLAALLNMGQTYMSWGYSALNSSSTDEEKAYSEGLVKKAVDYYDRYLDEHDSVAVEVDKALCNYYLGDSGKAIEELEAIAAKNPDNPLVWANLGMLYESQYNTEKATEAYTKATETDPDDEYGAYSYASQRLISLNSTVSKPGDAGDASADDVSTATSTGLTSTLASDSGVGF